MGVAAFFRRCALCAPIHFRQHLPRHDPADECVFRLLLCRLGQPDILPGRMNILFSDTRFDAGRPCFVCHLTLRLRAISRGESVLCQTHECALCFLRRFRAASYAPRRSRLKVCLLGKDQGVIHLDPEISDSAF
jgi:hypothetical protein